MTTYCTYITIYIGNKFPPFYIGYTKTENIYRGYKGSVCSKEYKDKWKFEIQNNSHLFKTYIISIHSTKEDANKKEIYLQNKLSVLKKPTMYLNRSIGRHCNNLGKNNPMYGKKHKKESIDQQKNKIKENYKNWLYQSKKK